MQELENNSAPANPPAADSAAAQPPASPPAAIVSANQEAHPPQTAKITIDDFARVDLRVGQDHRCRADQGADRFCGSKSISAMKHDKSLRESRKPILPETLIGRKVVIVANLLPRGRLRGLESNGMIVAASLGDQDAPVLAGFFEDAAIGRG